MKKISSLFLGAFALPVALVAQENCGVSATLTIDPPTCGENADGSLTINATGGTGSYSYYLNTVNMGGPTANDLGTGAYSYWVVDGANCWFKADFYLDCEPEKDNCEFRTQTQGGWGASPNGNNPAMYLQNHFLSCFPNGITIGCTSGNTLTLTTSVAVKNFLPSGSTASQLPNDMVNPGGSYNNVLAGQLVAAVINATVDACDPDFSSANSSLADLVYNSGPFAGQTVGAVIDAANQFIGGCGGSYTASQFNSALTALNENYVDGGINKGKFDCGGKKAIKLGTDASMEVYPNPAIGTVTVSVMVGVGSGSLEVMDIAGRVMHTERLVSDAQDMRTITLALDQFQAGTYSVVLRMNGATTTKRLVVSK